MKFALLTKRHYTNKDILDDRFGRLFHLPDQLVNLGHDGLVITGDLHAKRDEKRQINGLDYYSKPLSLSRLYGFIKYAYLLLKKERPQVLMSSGDTYWGYIGLRLARKLGIPFVFDVYDDYTAFGTNKIPGMKRLFFHTVQNADMIIAAGPPLKEFLSPHNNSIVVIENGIDPKLFRPIPRQQARAQLDIPLKDTVIGYFGAIEQNLGIEVLINAATLLKQEVSGLRLLIAGPNNLNLDFASYDFIDYRGFLPQKTVPLLINSCNVAVIPYLPSKIKQLCNACKISEYLACKVPVVATNVSDHENVFRKNQRAVCDPGNSKSMAAAISLQIKSPQLADFQNNLTWDKLAKKLSLALDSLLTRQQPEYDGRTK